MKFVVKEFLSARFAGLPRGRWPNLTASGRTASHSSFPGNGLERIAGGPDTESYGEMPDPVQDLPFLAFVASDGARRATAGKEMRKARAPHAGRALSPARRAMTTARWHFVVAGGPCSSRCGSRLNPDVTVDPPLSRSNPCNNHNNRLPTSATAGSFDHRRTRGRRKRRFACPTGGNPPSGHRSLSQRRRTPQRRPGQGFRRRALPLDRARRNAGEGRTLKAAGAARLRAVRGHPASRLGRRNRGRRQRARQFQPARHRGAGRDRQQQGTGSSACHFRPRQTSRRRHRRHRRSRRRQGDPQAGQQCRRAVLRRRLFLHRRPRRARTTSWSRSSACAPISRQNFWRDLLRRAKDTVRNRLLAVAPPAVQEEIRQVLNEIARETPASGTRISASPRNW